jgi:uncharacterized protein YdhG (YjbR/CyaY superfamily)
MAESPATTVTAYIAAFPAEVQAKLRELRAAIRKVVPAAEEKLSYKIPTYSLPGGPVIYFAGWKKYLSMYPVSAAMKKTLGDRLDGYTFAQGTLRFPLGEPLPRALIARVVKLRVAEVSGRPAGKRPAGQQAAAKPAARPARKPAATPARKPAAKPVKKR